MKKIVALFLTLTCILGIVACSKEGKDGSQDLILGEQYVNELAGISFELPAGWRFCTEHEVEGTGRITGNLIKTGFYKQDDDKEPEEAVLEMMAIDPVTGYNVSIVMEKSSFTSVKKYNQCPLDRASTIMGYMKNNQGVIGKPIKITIGGELWEGEELSCVERVPLKKAVYYYETIIFRKCGNYFFTIIIETTAENAVDDILPYFRRLGAK